MKSLYPFVFIFLFFVNVKALPVNFRAYPNPFSQTVYFEFYLDSSATASVNVFDMVGSNVALVMADTFLSGGNYQFNTVLNYLKAGVYFAELKVNDLSNWIKILKVDNATFNCPLQANSALDTVNLNFTVTDSLGDTVKYSLYNRWGIAEIELDTFLTQGNYSFTFILSGVPDGTYVQSFWQDTSNCRGTIVLGDLSAIENGLNAENFSVNYYNNTVEIKAKELYHVSVVNILGETILETQSNSQFYLKSGLYFFRVKDVNRNLFSVVKYWLP